MGNSEATMAAEKWDRTYAEIKGIHDAAYRCIDAAITLEEEQRPHEALDKYKRGISLIDEALACQVEAPLEFVPTWDEACVMVTKMKRTRGELLMRIKCIQGSPEFCACAAPSQPQLQERPPPPPSYDEAMSDVSSESGARPRTYSELANALEHLELTPPHADDKPADVQQAAVLYTQDNVKVYFISPDGTVTSYSDLCTLSIVSMVQGDEIVSTFMQIEEWIYPLIAGVSPCYRTDFGAFILPDINAPAPGSAVGFLLPPEVDAQCLMDLLEQLLHGVGQAEQVAPAMRTATRTRRHISSSHTISNGLVNGAWYIQQGLIKGAEKAAQFISYGTPKLINQLRPADHPQEISPTLITGFQTAKQVTGTAASITGLVAGKVGQATMALGRYLAPHVQRQGTKLISSGFAMDEQQAQEKMDGILTVAAGAVESLATVYTGLEVSAGILGQNITNNTVKIVEHKYGQPAGNLTGDTINTVGNVYNISHNIGIFQPKTFAKKAAKSASKAVLDDFILNHQRMYGPEAHMAYDLLNLSEPSTSTK